MVGSGRWCVVWTRSERGMGEEKDCSLKNYKYFHLFYLSLIRDNKLRQRDIVKLSRKLFQPGPALHLMKIKQETDEFMNKIRVKTFLTFY